MYDETHVLIDELIGKTLKKVTKLKNPSNDDILLFTTDNNRIYIMYHKQDCCESVSIEDIVGDLDDLINVPIIKAYESYGGPQTTGSSSETWTFYNIATVKGSVTIRWYGTSNGYYSESADFALLSRMPLWISELYKHGPKISLPAIHFAIVKDCDKCRIMIKKEAFTMSNIQNIINYIQHRT